MTFLHALREPHLGGWLPWNVRVGAQRAGTKSFGAAQRCRVIRGSGSLAKPERAKAPAFLMLRPTLAILHCSL